MSKAHRGKNLKAEKPKLRRVECPLCKRTGVKAIYEVSADDKKANVCKPCSKAVAHGKKTLASA
ncbi:MAG: hypothetical protein FWE37_06460 [Spirochaetaceae bacterium]|nr:hypothetical protein [Spirochaetaceae bacterium]